MSHHLLPYAVGVLVSATAGLIPYLARLVFAYQLVKLCEGDSSCLRDAAVLLGPPTRLKKPRTKVERPPQ